MQTRCCKQTRHHKLFVYQISTLRCGSIVMEVLMLASPEQHILVPAAWLLVGLILLHYLLLLLSHSVLKCKLSCFLSFLHCSLVVSLTDQLCSLLLECFCNLCYVFLPFLNLLLADKSGNIIDTNRHIPHIELS